jgi:hypothetical protein
MEIPSTTEKGGAGADTLSPGNKVQNQVGPSVYTRTMKTYNTKEGSVI